MSTEKAKILEMIQEGKITAAEGLELLNALEESDAQKSTIATSGINKHFLRVRVDADKAKVNVNIPLSLIKATSKIAMSSMNYIPEKAREEMEKKGIDLSKIDFEELIELIDQGLVTGKLVDVEADDERHGKSKVEVYVE